VRSQCQRTPVSPIVLTGRLVSRLTRLSPIERCPLSVLNTKASDTLLDRLASRENLDRLCRPGEPTATARPRHANATLLDAVGTP